MSSTVVLSSQLCSVVNKLRAVSNEKIERILNGGSALQLVLTAEEKKVLQKIFVKDQQKEDCVNKAWA